VTGTLAGLAARHWRDYRAREPGTCFADPGFTLDLRQVYELQGAVSALRVTVIELHNFVFRARRKVLSELAASNGLNAGVVLDPVTRRAGLPINRNLAPCQSR
jgi:hypothetical protein